MARRIVAVLILLALAAILFVAVWPQAFGLATAPIIAQVVSLRGIDVAIALGIAVVFGIVALVWRGRSARAARRFLGGMIALLLVFSVASAGILLSRGFGQGAVPAASAGDVTILEWNTKGDAPGAEGIAKLALAQKADIVALPETTLITGKEVAVLMKAAGRPMWVYSLAYDYISKSRSTTLLVSSSLGRYTATTVTRTTSVLPTVIAKPKTTGAPTIIAVHAVAPKPNFMRNWRNDLSTLSGLCSGENTIMIGDFNSTLDSLGHYSRAAGDDFGNCRDAGSVRSAASVGTWPTNIPPVLGAQIDHVMTTSAWTASSMRVITDEDAAGSDHRPIVVTLSPRH